MNIFAEDHSRNSKDVVYSYYRYSRDYTSNVIVVDLDPVEDTLSSFASVNRMMPNKSPPVQQVVLVKHNAVQLQHCVVNFKNAYTFLSKFILSLIDSSNGAVVCGLITL